MRTAIEYLKITLEILKTNEPINRAEGNLSQADMEKHDIGELERVIGYLENLCSENLIDTDYNTF